MLVEKSVGQVSQEGDSWSAENMNDMENRISNAFADADAYADAKATETLNSAKSYADDVGYRMRDSAIESSYRYTDGIRTSINNVLEFVQRRMSWAPLNVSHTTSSFNNIRFNVNAIIQAHPSGEQVYSEYRISGAVSKRPGGGLKFCEIVFSDEFLLSSTRNSYAEISLDNGDTMNIQSDGTTLYVVNDSAVYDLTSLKIYGRGIIHTY